MRPSFLLTTTFKLKKFGSVLRLKTATLEQIAKVPGFGGKAAEELEKFLEARTIHSLGVLINLLHHNVLGSHNV
jgi:NAD-dependent DNA ligase